MGLEGGSPAGAAAEGLLPAGVAVVVVVVVGEAELAVVLAAEETAAPVAVVGGDTWGPVTVEVPGAGVDDGAAVDGGAALVEGTVAVVRRLPQLPEPQTQQRGWRGREWPHRQHRGLGQPVESGLRRRLQLPERG